MSTESNNPTFNAGGDKPAAGGARRYRYSTASTTAAADATVLRAAAALPSVALDWNKITMALVAVGICFLALYRSELLGLTNIWYTDIGWSHGFVVPLISVFFVWARWDTLRRLTPKGTWVGLMLVLLATVGQMLFRASGTVQMSNLSVLVLLYGVVLFVFGWEHLRILWLPITYLVFAIPPPSPLYVAMTTPMQQIAASIGVTLLPLFGAMGLQHGTTIQVATAKGMMSLNVEEACSGMRMLVAFFALAVALAYSTNRPIWQKVFLALSALPIAILCNGLRVTLTGVLGAKLGEEWAHGATHETLGLLMLIPAMFMQLGLAWLLDKKFGLQWVLDRMFIEDAGSTGGTS